MIVIVIVEGDNATITDEAGRFLDRPSVGRVLPRFTKNEQRVASERGGAGDATCRVEARGMRLIGFFEATYEHGNLELGDRIPKAP
jgi:hypothetical protein